MARVLPDKMPRQQTGSDVFDLSSICVDGNLIMRYDGGGEGKALGRVALPN